MTTRLMQKAIEQSTYVVFAAFLDTKKQPVTPNVVTWTLTDRFGAVVNGRLDVAVDALTFEIPIVLSGADLQVLPTGVTRHLTVSCTYDSIYGNDLPINDECTFEVQDLLSVEEP